MSESHWRVRAAVPADLGAIESLLQATALPLAGVREGLSTLLVAAADAVVVGCVGLELHADQALLRSLAVDSAWQRRGLGTDLVGAALARARQLEIDAVYLITVSAAAWFADRGAESISRAELPSALLASALLQGACPSTAALFRLRVPAR